MDGTLAPLLGLVQVEDGAEYGIVSVGQLGRLCGRILLLDLYEHIGHGKDISEDQCLGKSSHKGMWVTHYKSIFCLRKNV